MKFVDSLPILPYPLTVNYKNELVIIGKARETKYAMQRIIGGSVRKNSFS